MKRVIKLIAMALLVASCCSCMQRIDDQARVENEILVAKAEKEKLLIQAQAEKEANALKTIALTPAVLEQMWIEKWDSHLPQYGQVRTLFKDIRK